MEPDLEHLLSDADTKEVESLYHRMHTPLRCRFGLHHWGRWDYMLSVQFGAQSTQSGRTSEVGQLDIELRMCPNCVKTQVRTIKANHIDNLGLLDEDDEDEDEDE